MSIVFNIFIGFLLSCSAEEVFEDDFDTGEAMNFFNKINSVGNHFFPEEEEYRMKKDTKNLLNLKEIERETTIRTTTTTINFTIAPIINTTQKKIMNTSSHTTPMTTSPTIPSDILMEFQNDTLMEFPKDIPVKNAPVEKVNKDEEDPMMYKETGPTQTKIKNNVLSILKEIDTGKVDLDQEGTNALNKAYEDGEFIYARKKDSSMRAPQRNENKKVANQVGFNDNLDNVENAMDDEMKPNKMQQASAVVLKQEDIDEDNIKSTVSNCNTTTTKPSMQTKGEIIDQTQTGTADGYGYCHIGEKSYQTDDTWHPIDTEEERYDPCVKCLCSKNQITCGVIRCTEPVCHKPITRPDVCCKLCKAEEIAEQMASSRKHCQFNDKIYRHAAGFPDDQTSHTKDNECIWCICMDGDVVCRLKKCPKPNCSSGYRMVPAANTCCLGCSKSEDTNKEQNENTMTSNTNSSTLRSSLKTVANQNKHVPVTLKLNGKDINAALVLPKMPPNNDDLKSIENNKGEQINDLKKSKTEIKEQKSQALGITHDKSSEIAIDSIGNMTENNGMQEVMEQDITTQGTTVEKMITRREIMVETTLLEQVVTPQSEKQKTLIQSDDIINAKSSSKIIQTNTGNDIKSIKSPAELKDSEATEVIHTSESEVEADKNPEELAPSANEENAEHADTKEMMKNTEEIQNEKKNEEESSEAVPDIDVVNITPSDILDAEEIIEVNSDKDETASDARKEDDTSTKENVNAIKTDTVENPSNGVINIQDKMQDTCSSEDKTYGEGERWHPYLKFVGVLECTVCSCEKGIVYCSDTKCHHGACSKPQRIPGKCCRVCLHAYRKAEILSYIDKHQNQLKDLLTDEDDNLKMACPAKGTDTLVVQSTSAKKYNLLFIAIAQKELQLLTWTKNRNRIEGYTRQKVKKKSISQILEDLDQMGRYFIIGSVQYKLLEKFHHNMESFINNCGGVQQDNCRINQLFWSIKHLKMVDPVYKFNC